MDEMQIVIAASALGFAAVGAGITWVFMSAKVKLPCQEKEVANAVMKDLRAWVVMTEAEIEALRPDAQKHRDRLAEERQRRAAKKAQNA
jgi:hypothetical protein